MEAQSRSRTERQAGEGITRPCRCTETDTLNTQTQKRPRSVLPTPAPGPNRQWRSAIRYLIISCAQCQEEFKTDRKRKYCAPKCREKANKAKRPDRHKRDPYYDKVCANCQEPYKTQDKRAIYCCRMCRSPKFKGWSKSTEIVHVPRPERQYGAPPTNQIPARKGLALVSGPCGWCTETFVGQPMTRYCSKRCYSNAAWKRRYDIRGDFNPTPRLRRYICERDNWTCQICQEPVDPEAKYQTYGYATLDHIIPQSHQLIPDHTESNLRLAHMICNARRGDRIEYALTV